MSEVVLAKPYMNGLMRMEIEEYFADTEIENLYSWLDGIRFSRPKKNVAKDFSDGVLVAEIVYNYFPRLVHLHSYTPASAPKQKMETWYYLNRRVLKRLQLDLSDDIIRALSYAKPKVAEKVLMMLRVQIDKYLEKMSQHRPNNSLDLAMLGTPRKPLGYDDVPQRKIYKTSHIANDAILAPIIDNVARELVDDKDKESVAKSETIEIINTKIRRLEHLLSLKDVRIEDLENRISTLHQEQLGQLSSARP